MIQLNIAKAGDQSQKLQLNLKKAAKFFIELGWDSQADPDAHALAMANGKVFNGDPAFVLSTYNTKLNNPGAGTLDHNADKSFSLPDLSLTHSGDVLTGKPEGVSEMITVDTGRMNPLVDEIGVFITIHKPKNATFQQVGNCKMRIRNDDNEVLAEALLTAEFGRYNVVQMGSFLRNGSDWSYSSAGQGITGDFNSILANFS